MQIDGACASSFLAADLFTPFNCDPQRHRRHGTPPKWLTMLEGFRMTACVSLSCERLSTSFVNCQTSSDPHVASVSPGGDLGVSKTVRAILGSRYCRSATVPEIISLQFWRLTMDLCPIDVLSLRFDESESMATLCDLGHLVLREQPKREN